jgi:cation transport ATPase
VDPNRYNENRNIRPDSPWQIIQALLTVALLICALIGLAVNLFGSHTSPMDWLHWITASTFNIVLTILGAVVLIGFHRYITVISNEKRHNASNFPVYVMMLIGVYFLYRLLTTGHW